MLVEFAGFALIAEVLFIIGLLIWTCWKRADIYPSIVTSVILCLIGLDWFNYFATLNHAFTGLGIVLIFLGGFVFLHMIFDQVIDRGKHD